MRNKLLVFAWIAVILFSAAMVAPASAVITVTKSPLEANHTFAGLTLTAVDSSYNSKDYLITSGNQLDLEKIAVGLVLPKEDAYVVLGETSLLSEAAVDTDSDFSRTLINNTYNTAVESNGTAVTVNSQLASSYTDTRLDGQVDFFGNEANTAAWKSDCYTDYNGDGDYEDSGDKSYRTSLGKVGQVFYWNAKATWNTTDADNYMKLTWSFKTSGTSNYDFEIIYYTTSGDSAWSNIDSAGENKITVSLYDTNNTAIAGAALLDELLETDLGDNPVISGLDYIQCTVGTNPGAEATHILVDVRINNWCVFTDYPAVTDYTDDDNDWDINGASGGLWTGIWDDNDILVTSITEGATEVYDSNVPLYTAIDSSVKSPYSLKEDAKKLTFGGIAYYEPSTWSVTSVQNEGEAFYRTTEKWTYDTTVLSDLQTATNVITWTDTYYNMTLDEDVLYSDFSDFDDDLLVFTFESVDKVETLRSDWASVTADDQDVNYDGTNPDTSTGSAYDLVITYRSDHDYEGSGTATAGGSAVTTGGDNTMLVIGVLFAAVVVLAGAWGVLRYKKGQDMKKKSSHRKHGRGRKG